MHLPRRERAPSSLRTRSNRAGADALPVAQPREPRLVHEREGRDDEDARDDMLYDVILEGHVDFDYEVWDDISKDAKAFIKKCLTMNPRKRAKVGKLRSALPSQQSA